MTQTVEPEIATQDPRARADWWPGLRALLLRLHTYAGILIGPFLLVAACTGLLYVFSPQIDKLLYAHQLTVPAAPGNVPLTAQIDTARAQLPGAGLHSVLPSASPTQSTQVVFDAPDQGAEHFRSVFVDPHDGSVRGTLENYRNVHNLPVQSWFDELHRGLHLGQFGLFYSELAASWMWVLVLAGLVLWLRKRFVARRSGTRRRAVNGRRRLLSWHGWAGLGISLVLLFLSATGMTWSTLAGDNVSKFRAQLSWQAPEVSTTLPARAAVGADIGFDRVRAAVSDVGLRGPLEITPPSGPGAAYEVKREVRAWPGSIDTMAVDPGTGWITADLPYSGYPFMAKLSHWMVLAHQGLLFGLVNQIVLAIVAIALILVIVLGYRMWWMRGPAKRGFGRLPARGTWRRVPGKVLAPIVLGAVLAGYFAPLLGGSLLLFLLIDGLLALRSGRTEAGA